MFAYDPADATAVPKPSLTGFTFLVSAYPGCPGKEACSNSSSNYFYTVAYWILCFPSVLQLCWSGDRNDCPHSFKFDTEALIKIVKIACLARLEDDRR